MIQEMKWITIWILLVGILAMLISAYFYLNNELSDYVYMIIATYILLILPPYSIWKYKQLKFVDKHSITIQMLHD